MPLIHSLVVTRMISFIKMKAKMNGHNWIFPDACANLMQVLLCLVCVLLYEDSHGWSMEPLWHGVRERVIHGLFHKLTFIWSYGRYRFNHIIVVLNKMRGPIIYLWLSKVLGDERRRHTYKVFSCSFRPCPTINRNRAQNVHFGRDKNVTISKLMLL